MDRRGTPGRQGKALIIYLVEWHVVKHVNSIFLDWKKLKAFRKPAVFERVFCKVHWTEWKLLLALEHTPITTDKPASLARSKKIAKNENALFVGGDMKKKSIASLAKKAEPSEAWTKKNCDPSFVASVVSFGSED